MTDSSSAMPFSREAVRSFQKAATEEGEVELNPFAARAARQFNTEVISPQALGAIWRLVEFAAMGAIGIATLIAFGLPGSVPFWRHVAIAALGGGATLATLQIADGYQVQILRTTKRQLLRLFAALAGALAPIACGLLLFAQEPQGTLAWCAGWFAAAFVVLGGARLILASNIRRWVRNGVMERRAIIVGGGTGAETLIRGLEMQPDSDIRICGIFDDRGDRRSPAIVAGYPKLGNMRELVEFARLARIDMLIVTLPLSAEKRLLSLLKDLWVLPLDIRLSAQSSDLTFRPRSCSSVGQYTLVDVFERPLAEWDRIAKRIFDLVFGTLALIALSPVFLATAIAIKRDSKGPVFFRQKRHGFNNQIVEVFKFRSMYHEMADPTARKVVTKGDPRVTKVGRFIRKSSIDELPQLFNVLAGELSLVGPRPHAVHAVSSGNEAFVEIVDGYFGRHKVKPGITGWAQLKGFRGEIDQPDALKHRVEHDLHYIENWSILMDLYILFATPFSLFKTERAY